MLKPAGLKRVVLGLALLGLLTAMGTADAQRKRMPSRTEPIPDTEPEAERLKAAKEQEAAPSLMIYGPPTPPLGAPPSPPIPESVVKPAESPAPAAPVAAPPPTPTSPTPVVTPTAPPPAPVAVPIPAPAPAAPVAKPEPPAPPPAPVAKPEPPAPPPAPVATPAPAAPPPTEAAPARVPAPPPVAAPAPAPTPPPRVAAPAPAPPVATPAPVTAPPPVAKPAPAAAPAPAKREVAAIAPTSSPFAAPKLDARTVEQIFSCLAPGLPQDWKKSWVILTGSEGSPTAKFLVTTTYRDEDAEEFVPCDAREITRRIAGLSASLPPEQQRWRSAQLAIDSEGQYTLKYDYAR